MDLCNIDISTEFLSTPNDIKMAIYKNSDPTVIVDSITETGTHAARVWAFANLQRVMHFYKLYELNGSGTVINTLIGPVYFVPSNQTFQSKDAKLIHAGFTPIPGSTGGGSTIATNYVGNPTSSSWAFTLKGTPQPGAIVAVNFTWDDGSGTISDSVTSTVLSGWTLADLVSDLLTKIVAINVNSLSYTDTDSFTGVRVRGLTTASGSVTITNTSGAAIWPTNVNTVTVPDWVGWQLESFVRPGGVGELKYDKDQPVDFSWDPATGILTLQQTGDVFQPGEWFIAHFQNKYIQASGGVSGGSWSSIYEITADTLLTAGDIGKKILINPAGTYLEITLPDLSLVAENKITWFEMDVSFDNTTGFVQKCAMIKTHAGDVIQWLEGNRTHLYTCPCESFEMYKRTLTPSGYEWRVQNADGNFKTVGESETEDVFSNSGRHNVINKIYALGSAISSDAFARLYNDYVLKLDAGSVVSYASWGVGDNGYKWSLKDPSTGNFRVPLSGPAFDRPNNGSQTAGAKVRDTILKHKHATPYNDAKGFGPPFGSAGYTNKFGAGGGNDSDNDWWYTNDGSELSGATTQMNDTGAMGTETAPIHRITNKYFRC